MVVDICQYCWVQEVVGFQMCWQVGWFICVVGQQGGFFFDVEVNVVGYFFLVLLVNQCVDLGVWIGWIVYVQVIGVFGEVFNEFGVDILLNKDV